MYYRLDRFYFNREFFEIIKNEDGVQYVVIPYTLSNHHPIMIGLKINNRKMALPSPNLNFRMNTNLLKDGDLKCALYLVRMYNKCGNNKLSNIQRWNQNIATWTSLCQVVGKKKAKDTKASEIQLNNILQVVEYELQRDPKNATLTYQLIRAKNDLRRLQNQKIKGWRERAKLNWLDSGD